LPRADGMTSASAFPALCSEVTAVSRTCGCRASQRISSAPAYPVAPTTATRMGSGVGTTSALRVLRPLTGLVTAVLLALDLAWVGGDEARALQGRAELRVREQEGARDAVANRRRLRGDAAAADAHRRVVLASRLGDVERLVDDHPRRLAAEVVVGGSGVD